MRLTRRLFVAFGVIVALLLTWSWLQPSPEDEMADLVAELRARGEPTTYEELWGEMPPDDENGARDLDAAFAWWEENKPPDGWETRVAGPWNHDLVHPWWETASAEQMAALGALLSDLAPYFALVDRAAEKPVIAWPIRRPTTADEAFDMHVPIRDLQHMGMALSARAMAGPSAADRAQAMVSRLRIGARLRRVGVLSALVGMAMHNLSAVSVQQRLAAGDVGLLAHRDSLDAALAFRWIPELHAIFRADLVCAIEYAPFIFDGTLDVDPSAADRLDHAWRRLRRGRVDFGGPAYSTSFATWLRQFDAVVEQASSPRELCRAAEAPALARNRPVTIVPKVTRALVRADAASAIARLALAASVHHRAHGRWPASPDDLAPFFADGVPFDPCTDEPFSLVVEDGALVLRATPWEGATTSDSDAELIDAGLLLRLPPPR